MTDDTWPGELSSTLDELAAFDAMQAFLEAYWERGLRNDDGIARLLGNLSRSVWQDHSTADPAMWQDWKEAIALIRGSAGGVTIDPLASGLQRRS